VPVLPLPAGLHPNAPLPIISPMSANTHSPAWLLAAALALTGCASTKKAPPPFGLRVAQAHGYSDWQGKKDALKADVHLTIFGETPGQNRFFDADFTYECSTGRTRMHLADNTVIVFDGKKTWVSPADAKVQKPRFIVKTWPFMVAAPLRLMEPGITHGEVEMRPLGGQQCPTMKLSFAPGADHGDADWCIAYADPKTYKLLALTYALPAGKGVDGFSEDTLAVTFYEPRQVDGIVFGTEWRIWKWNKEFGFYDKPIAEGRVYNIEFLYPKKNQFTAPPGAREAVE
jgi:hypothetical protein